MLPMPHVTACLREAIEQPVDILKTYKLFGIFMDAEGRLAEHPRDASLLLTLASGCML